LQRTQILSFMFRSLITATIYVRKLESSIGKFERRTNPINCLRHVHWGLKKIVIRRVLPQLTTIMTKATTLRRILVMRVLTMTTGNIYQEIILRMTTMTMSLTRIYLISKPFIASKLTKTFFNFSTSFPNYFSIIIQEWDRNYRQHCVAMHVFSYSNIDLPIVTSSLL
jgi:hypothetical protein